MRTVRFTASPNASTPHANNDEELGFHFACARLLEMLGASEQRALAAAVTVASAQGLKSDAPVVIHSASNVLVHLRPAPVVARVMTGTVALHDDPRRWLEREVAVLEFLKPSGLAVSPNGLTAPGRTITTVCG
jgi:hypothetical protein